MVGFFSDIFSSLGYFQVFLDIQDIISFLEVVSKIFLSFIEDILKGAANQYPRPSWCFTWNNHPVMSGNTRNIFEISKTSGLPEISDITQYFVLPAIRWFSKLNEGVAGSGSGSGTRWALIPVFFYGETGESLRLSSAEFQGSKRFSFRVAPSQNLWQTLQQRRPCMFQEDLVGGARRGGGSWSAAERSSSPAWSSLPLPGRKTRMDGVKISNKTLPPHQSWSSSWASQEKAILKKDLSLSLWQYLPCSLSTMWSPADIDDRRCT